MAASIDFDDGVPTTLTAASTAGRFNNWTPDPRPVDASARSVGTGEVITAEFRESAVVRFEMPLLQTDLPVASRLMKHLWGGGSCTLNTDDATSVVFSTMAIATEGGRRVRPELVRSDAGTIDYRLTLALQYIGSGAVTDLNIEY